MAKYLWRILVACILATSASLVWQGVRGQPPVQPPRAPGEDEVGIGDSLPPKVVARARFEAARANVLELKKARLATARKAMAATKNEFLVGRGNLEVLYEWSGGLLEAELALLDQPTDRKAAREKHWTRLREIEEVNKIRFEAARIPIQEYLGSQYQRQNAEIELAEKGGK
jgi:hypothetical protein